MMKVWVITIIMVTVIFLGSIPQSLSGTSREFIVVANTIDTHLSSDTFSLLESLHSVQVVHPSEFDTEMNSPQILFLGGASAPEGTGALVNSFLSPQETRLIEKEGVILVKMNIWTSNQVVIVIAGADRQQTASLCHEYIQALPSLLNSIQAVRNQCTEDTAAAFLWPVPITPEDRIAPSFSSTEGTIPPPYLLDEPCWFFWIDEYPCAKFAHPCTYLFVDIFSGNITVHHETWWPVLNAASLWSSSDYWKPTYWVQAPQFSPSSQHVEYAVPSVQSDGSDRVLLINGWAPGHPLRDDFHEDEQMMTALFTAAGLQVTTVRTIPGIQTMLSQWSGEMKSGSTCLLYISAHGTEGSILAGDTFLRVADIKNMLLGFGGVHVIVIVDSPCGRGVLEELQGMTEAIMMATLESCVYGDLDPECDVNPTDGGSEFSSSLAESMYALITDQVRMNTIQGNAVALRESRYTGVLCEAFTTGIALDAGALLHYTLPHLWRRNTTGEFIQKEYKEASEECACG